VSVEPGLCATCRHGRRIDTARGSTFWLCRRSATDPRYPRYPALPVQACPGFEPDSGSPAKRDVPPA
jgi:hypothetical protein